MKTSPTQRSLKLLREEGYTVAIVERWNVFAKVRQDLFKFIDILAIKPGEILAVQTTTSENMAARRKKITNEPLAAAWLSAGGQVVLHGWKKKGRRSTCEVEKVHMSDCTIVWEYIEGVK